MDKHGRWGKLKWCDNRNRLQHINQLILLDFKLLQKFRYPQKYPRRVWLTYMCSQL